ncbi:hypothetical protein A3A46_02785 [Candidatus Roizmanbacteria bacterium RIFCSPLOWO2_01_FULL_37_13]|uniref:Membrane protein 6-pyruvoyl-tetrahydropterin synthase-related domain-containing protein n=1 Tax=Candidatus Roizmanbacteria bacterium RIFCSPHIGHO2_02_FULL_38_11 TaxID=1802039 RepID=A0A1F7H2Q4_9BACT|nr:MAG: hypothetical protein A3C25_00135 [Candidatus Roizmanbacteria bacterium RIFCSPHIGHO2_02_FULL_38_11]OGK43051.1 MAG: hypothetical protein A3A46_02785 [Candidatus Roizmanbacteria bacterium RIFCSPLOWO2_01_FULL_37_13]
MTTIKRLFVLISLIFLIGINFYLYRNEFKVLVDPNDNIFQYALIDEAKMIWKNIFAGKLSLFYLLDSWNERWAEGFALSNYYSHLPQAVIAFLSFILPTSSFQLFVVIRTLMLILLPLMFFWGGTILHLPVGFSLILAFFSQAIFTDGLYGIDVSSFLWRGWGLSAQLMAVFFLPVAFAYAIDYFENKKNLGKAIFFNFLVASCHFGIFSLALLGYPLYWFVSVIPDLFGNLYNSQLDSRFRHVRRGFCGNDVEKNGDNKVIRADNIVKMLKRVQHDNSGLIIRVVLFISLTLFSLSYFIIPFFLQGQFRNFSVWDPIWKFDSWGIKQVFVWFLNGDLFDFGRFPFITLCVVFGLFVGFIVKNRLMKFLSLLFVFYFVLFFGRTTLGGLIDLIPGFSEYHSHRIIVMVQFTGIFLGAWFVYMNLKNFQVSILNFQSIFSETIFKLFKIKNFKFNENLKLKISNSAYIVVGIFGLFLVYYLEQPLIKYTKDNAVWIERSNKAYLNDLPSYEKIRAKLTGLPKARVYVGRPGNWGKQFTVGEIPLYMVLSQDGFPVIGFLPESWSPNSDPEQFFDENKIEFYNLYNIGYSVLPDNIKPPDFTKLILKEGKLNLYEIKTNGWFGFGESSIAIKSKKTNLLNMTRLWFESKMFEAGDYPMIDLSKNPPDGKRWYIEMTDKNNFINLNDRIERNIWRANPFETTISSRSFQDGSFLFKNQAATPNGYRGEVKVDGDCQNCIVVLKQSYHPNWQVRLNGEKVNTFPVFPFYIGISLEKAGNYDVVAEYKPAGLKVILVWIEILVGSYFLGRYLISRSKIKTI